MNIIYILIIVVIVILFLSSNETNEIKCHMDNECTKIMVTWIKYKLDVLYYNLAIRNNTGECDRRFNDLKQVQMDLFNYFNKLYGSKNSVLFNKLMTNEFNIKLNLTLSVRDNNTELTDRYKTELEYNTTQIEGLIKKIKNDVNKHVKTNHLLKDSSIFSRVIMLGTSSEEYIGSILETATLLI
jgi:hypothetical protein